MKLTIFDLDGTLANIDHRLHFLKQENKDWHGFFKACPADLPKHAVIQTAKALYQLGHPLWILSGRSALVKNETIAWLKQQAIPYDKLLMREINDLTPDHELKRQWMIKYNLKPRILCIYEDRQQVVDMWRKEGFDCFQVAVPDEK